jgi:hypothetical protein
MFCVQLWFRSIEYIMDMIFMSCFKSPVYFSGFLQYIESTPVAEVLATEGSIQNFFRKHHPSETGPFGIAPDVMETYTSSCGRLN